MEAGPDIAVIACPALALAKAQLSLAWYKQPPNNWDQPSAGGHAPGPDVFSGEAAMDKERGKAEDRGTD